MVVLRMREVKPMNRAQGKSSSCSIIYLNYPCLLLNLPTVIPHQCSPDYSKINMEKMRNLTRRTDDLNSSTIQRKFTD